MFDNLAKAHSVSRSGYMSSHFVMLCSSEGFMDYYSRTMYDCELKKRLQGKHKEPFTDYTLE